MEDVCRFYVFSFFVFLFVVVEGFRMYDFWCFCGGVCVVGWV